MMVFWLSSQGVILISCSCCCSHTTWIYRWFVCDCLDNICYNFFPECQLKESIYLAQLLISAVCQKHWSSAQERVNFPSFHSLSRSSAGADLGGCRGCAPPPLRWSFRPHIYVLAFKYSLPHRQWRLSLAVHPLIRKILDPPLQWFIFLTGSNWKLCGKFDGNSHLWVVRRRGITILPTKTVEALRKFFWS